MTSKNHYFEVIFLDTFSYLLQNTMVFKVFYPFVNFTNAFVNVYLLVKTRQTNVFLPFTNEFVLC
jgi:hypothetical protein